MFSEKKISKRYSVIAIFAKVLVNYLTIAKTRHK